MPNKTITQDEIWKQIAERMHSTLPEGDIPIFDSISFVDFAGNKLILSVTSKYQQTRAQKLVEQIKNLADEFLDTDIECSLTIGETQKSEKRLDTIKSVAFVNPKKDSQFNPAYTLDNFVPGDNSLFAYNASCAIARNPGSSYNPCLIYGGVGLGKTHLLQGIGNYIEKNSPSMKVLYRTSEIMINEVMDAINKSKGAPEALKAKYRSYDVLLVDDIQFIENKTGTQEFLFNIFNTLFDSNRQMVFTSDRPVSEIKNIMERLKNRFQRGLNVDLQPPNYETRMAILLKKCEEQNISVSKDVLSYIANNVHTNVRDLEACLTKIVAFSRLVPGKTDVENTRIILRDIINSFQDKSSITIDLIIKTVAEYFNVSPIDIKGNKRSQQIVKPRQISMYVVSEMTEFSTTEIGIAFGNRDHTTVMHSVKEIKKKISDDPDLESTINALIRMVQDSSKKNM